MPVIGGITVSQGGWKMLEPTAELANMIMNGLVAPGTRQWVKGNVRVLFSPEEQHLDGIWAHLSISVRHRYPTWDEILDARYSFFPDTQEVVQVLPPKSEYVNFHPNCFHLWAPIGKRLTPHV